jgi:hypothetical protein
MKANKDAGLLAREEQIKASLSEVDKRLKQALEYIGQAKNYADLEDCWFCATDEVVQTMGVLKDLLPIMDQIVLDTAGGYEYNGGAK